MTIAEQIHKTGNSLARRGLPESSYFKVVFKDGSERTEQDMNWSFISERKTVSYFGGKKTVHLSVFPVRRIEVFHEGLHTAIDVPKDCNAYQAVRGETIVVPNVQRNDRVLGRIIGIVKDGEVIEERFLNALSNKVEGIRK